MQASSKNPMIIVMLCVAGIVVAALAGYLNRPQEEEFTPNGSVVLGPME